MKSLALLLALLLAAPPRSMAQAPLAFSARIQSEELAEEAIDLLHCLAEELELPWELNEESQAPYRLKVQEKDRRLHGNFITPEGEKAFMLGQGESNKICGELAPAAKIADSPSMPEKDWEPPEEKKSKWLWIGAAAAVLAGGFLLWNSRPDHRSFTME